jgi:hypothetical protein
MYSNLPQISLKAAIARRFRGKTGAGYVVLLQVRAKFNSVSNISFFSEEKCNSYFLNFCLDNDIKLRL